MTVLLFGVAVWQLVLLNASVRAAEQPAKAAKMRAEIADQTLKIVESGGLVFRQVPTLSP